MLTTTRRLALTVLLFLVWVPVANAWTWPVQGPVLQPFSYDEAHPYAAGQHRGIDIGANAAGERVVAPSTGTVSFAGSVPNSGESVTVETADGYSVTLTHLGSIAVSKGASVAEGDAVGTIGPSGTPEVDGPYLHLGIRVTSDPNGYLDPLRFLPQPSASSPAQSEQPVSQPSASGGAVGESASSAQPEPATSTSTPTATTQGANASTTPLSSRSRPGRGQAERSHSSGTAVREVPRSRSPQRLAPTDTRERGRLATPRRRIDVAPTSVRRPVVEASPSVRLRLDAGHELPASLQRPRSERSSVLLPLFCNGAAALVALAAAFAAGASGRRRVGDEPVAQVHRLSPRVAGRGRERRAA